MSSPGQRRARHLPPATPSPRRGHLTPPGHGRLPPPPAPPQPLPPAHQPAVSVSRRPQYQETLFVATLPAAYHRTGPCVKMCLLTQVLSVRPHARVSESLRSQPAAFRPCHPRPPPLTAAERRRSVLSAGARCTSDAPDRYVSESATIRCHSDARGSTLLAFRAPAPALSRQAQAIACLPGRRPSCSLKSRRVRLSVQIAAFRLREFKDGEQ